MATSGRPRRDGLPRRVDRGAFGAGGDPAIRVGDHRAGRVDVRGDRRSAPDAPREPIGGRCSIGRSGSLSECFRSFAASCSALPIALIFVAAVRIGRPDLPARRRGPARPAGRSRGAPGPGPVRICLRLAGSRTPVDRGGRDPAGRALVARCGRTDRCRGARPGSSGPPRRWSCSPSSTSIVGLFVGLQIAYLFGGLDTLVAAGMTYSDYARRGFFELVAAACLAGGGRRRPRDQRRPAEPPIPGRRCSACWV